MKVADSDWYKTGWSLDIKTHSWVEDTEHQVDFLIKTMGLTGKEKILDLACGYGRHALSFARRGYDVVGVDITQVFIEDALKEAQAAGLSTQFILADIRDITFESEFDVVLNLADGAIGYLENDAENLKLFDVIARALKPGGKHFMDVCSAEHAEQFFPKHHWDTGKKSISLSAFEWLPDSSRMLFGGMEIPYGAIAQPPDDFPYTTTRLYSKEEIDAILHDRGMEIRATFSDYYGKEASAREIQLMVYSQKR